MFSVEKGKYELNSFGSGKLIVNEGDLVIIARYNGRLAVKARNSQGFVCDSVIFSGQTEDDSFSLRINGEFPLRQYYSGDVMCSPDMETLVLVNICDIEKYIAGVVQAEGGNGKNAEYFKTQAVIARTYMYKYQDKHLHDRYNLCDDTHCQAYNGFSSDSLLINAVLETKGLVILDRDSALITAAFHSNCGGETSASEDVWLTSQPYLKRVTDPYCLSSRNAKWERTISIEDWIRYLHSSGYDGPTNDLSIFRHIQKSRSENYVVGSFYVPFRKIRNDMNLRSAFFSVIPETDRIRLEGRGYGHGVGLCQEGAMVMASKGFDFRQIIDFYYFGVIIDDIKNVASYKKSKN
jgi:stage II sporulation protein D